MVLPLLPSITTVYVQYTFKVLPLRVGFPIVAASEFSRCAPAPILVFAFLLPVRVGAPRARRGRPAVRAATEFSVFATASLLQC